MTSSDSSLPGPFHSPGASLPFKIMGGLALAFLLAVLVGFLLPGRWQVERTLVLSAPPQVIYPYLDSPERWEAWTPWGELESKLEGPIRGQGARRTWSDPDQGSGFMEITAAEPPRMVRYTVEVDGGAIRIDGRLALEEAPGGTRVTWQEEGDFGWNPILGYVALVMERSQGAQMSRSLERLQTAATAESAQP